MNLILLLIYNTVLGMLLAKFSPISVKCVLKASATSCLSVISTPLNSTVLTLEHLLRLRELS